MNAVIYARYSSQGQNEQSIEGQIRVCKEFAEQKGYKIITTYIDKAKTGTNDNRPDFQKMLNDAASGAFKYIIVYKFDRFARNRMDSIIHKHELKEQHGVKVISAVEPISDDEGGEFYEMFLEWDAEKYSKRLSRRINDGIDTGFANGTHLGGKAIFGYKLVSSGVTSKKGVTLHKVAIDEEQAKIVQYVFKQYVAGEKKDNIAKELNKQGHRLNDKLFKSISFDRWLNNEKYIGKFVFGKRVCYKTYPAIIETKLFEAAQKRLVKNKRLAGTNSAKEPYLLTGKLFCGHCATPMVADGGTSSNGSQYNYYACKEAKKSRCDKKREKKDFVEYYVVEQTINHLKDEQRSNQIANDIVKYWEDKTSESQLKSIENKITNTKKQIDAAVNATLETAEKETRLMFYDKIKELNVLLEDLKVQYSQLEIEQDLKMTKKDILCFIAELTKGDITNKDFRKSIIDNLVKSVYLYDDKFLISFNIDGSQEIAYVGLADLNDAINSVLPCSNSNTLAPPKKSARTFLYV